jgi:hypothetical protein
MARERGEYLVGREHPFAPDLRTRDAPGPSPTDESPGRDLAAQERRHLAGRAKGGGRLHRRGRHRVI